MSINRVFVSEWLSNNNLIKKNNKNQKVCLKYREIIKITVVYQNLETVFV